MRIYMAGPLFSTAECDFNKLLAEQLRLHGHDVFLPQEHEQDIAKLDLIFKSDKAGVDWCQLVLGNLDGPDPDSGTCWELGYGYGTNKAIMVYRTDLRVGVADPINLMLTESANLVLYVPKMPVQELAERIDQEIRNRFEPSRHKPMKADTFGGFDRERELEDAAGITPRYRHADK